MPIHNLQRKVQIDRKIIEAFVAALEREIAEVAEKNVTVAFVPDSRMKRLNEMFRGKDSTTDVLSFPNEPDDFLVDSQTAAGGGYDLHEANSLGDIVISAEQAKKQAEENGLSLEIEIKQLILHGVLHLCGYDHETDDGDMNARELVLREQLGI